MILPEHGSAAAVRFGLERAFENVPDGFRHVKTLCSYVKTCMKGYGVGPKGAPDPYEKIILDSSKRRCEWPKDGADNQCRERTNTTKGTQRLCKYHMTAYGGETLESFKGWIELHRKRYPDHADRWTLTDPEVLWDSLSGAKEQP